MSSGPRTGGLFDKDMHDKMDENESHRVGTNKSGV